MSPRGYRQSIARANERNRRERCSLATIGQAPAKSTEVIGFKLLFLAVGTHISPNLMFETLADMGAKNGMLLDGGDPSSMVIGTGASVVSPGAVAWLATSGKPIWS